MKSASLVFWFLCILALFSIIGFGIYSYVIDYQYENSVGAYMETATDTITPEAFKAQLIMFEDAINKSGLTPEDYGAMWFKKPDNSMVFQMQHVDSIIGRADAMIQWKNTVYSNGTQSLPVGQVSAEAFRDVYNDKMNNLRTYIHAEGDRSDWIAKDAWYVKFHPIMYFSWAIGLALCSLALLFGIIGAATWSDY